MMPAQILKVLSQGHDRWPGEALEAATAQRSDGQWRALRLIVLEGKLDRSALLRIFAGHAFGKSFARRKGAVDLVGTGETRLALTDLAPLVRDAPVDKATNSKRLLGFRSLSRGGNCDVWAWHSSPQAIVTHCLPIALSD